MSTQHFETIIIGGGQAGLAMGYHLARRGRPFVILEANDRIGDSWRNRWDSLRLFTPARYDGLPGLPFPAPGWSFPTRDEFADYLRDYAAHWDLPVRTRSTVRSLSHDGTRYVIETADACLEADNVVLASGFDRLPKVPDFAAQLDPAVVQLHAVDYRDPAQLRDGDVLVVGAGNSGADIALDLAPGHRVLLSGRHPGEVPWQIDRWPARLFTPVLFFGFSHVLTVRTPVGRRMRRRVLAHSGPLVRVKSARPRRCRRGARTSSGRRPRRTAAARGRPRLERGQRRVVHRIPAGHQLDRPSGLRPDRRADATPRRRRHPTRPVLPRADCSSTRWPPR